MIVNLREVSWSICDDFEGYEGWKGISCGDIYIGDTPFGTYVAAWYPNLNKDLEMLITAFRGEPPAPALSVGFLCPVGQPEAIRPVSPELVPWTGDGVVFMDPLHPDDIGSYPIAGVAVQIAPQLLRLDTSLLKYIEQPAYIIASPR